MQVIKYPQKAEWQALLKRPVICFDELESSVKTILNEVKQNEDEAVRKYTLQFNKVSLEKFLVTKEEFEAAELQVPKSLKQAIALAKLNIEKFHLSQKEEIKIIETQPGVACWRKSVGIETVGLYIPGGTAPLFSTILMLAVPATIAGCKKIILTSPPSADGKLHPAILYTAKLCGITNVFKIGGVQAIAAMAYGTKEVPKVLKIAGPGNQYVTLAKQLVNKEGIAIDMPAGPSEVAVLADESCIPKFVAADLLSQAEHGTDSQVMLVSTKEEIIRDVMNEMQLQVEKLPRKEIIKEALKNSKAVLVKTIEEGIALLNDYAPEHLIMVCNNSNELVNKIINAGSVFIGNYACESAGDYASGTNHTLPTNGYATAYSGVSVDSFVKKITFQHLTKEGLGAIAYAIEAMAEAEGLSAHKNAVRIRLKERIESN